MRDRARPESVTGRALLAAAMLGLAEALEMSPPRDEPVIEERIGGDGDPIDLYLDPYDPRLTVAFVRPWLMT